MLSPQHSRLVLSIILGLLVACNGDTIKLKGGQVLEAEILKADDNTLYLDLDFDILRLPRSEVVEIIPQGTPVSEPTSPEPNTPLPADPNQGNQIYYRRTLATTSIESNVQRFGEAVVLVTSPSGQGSGFIINEQGYLITNYHVIARETQLKVTVFHGTGSGFEQKQFRKVKIVAINPFVDLALLRIEEPYPFKYAYFGEIERVETGESVFAIGNPLGLTRTVSQGIVSASNRNHVGRLYIQTTTDINPGNSGGPLFNMRGEVIGVTSMGYLYLGGLNFAIPIDVVARFLNNWDAFAYDESNPNTGYRYLQPTPRQNPAPPKQPKLPG